MKSKTVPGMAVVVFLGVLTVPALAHQPTLSDGSAGDPDSAIELPNVQISRVIYHEVTDGAPRVWLTFEVDAPQTLLMQLGLPVIDRLVDYRPAMALLGPGLEPIELPFDVPEGLGGILLSSVGVEEPRRFDEPFSGTSSWIVVEQDVQLPQAGRYYVVAFDPTGQPGKLWVGLGREEEFGLDVILELPGLLPLVQGFHETAAGGGVPCLLFPLAAVLTLGCVGWFGCGGRERRRVSQVAG